MKRPLLETATVSALTLAILLLRVVPGAADGWTHNHHYKDRVAYVEYAPDYSACRTGWWQSLRYGHVRPHWGTWCR